MDRGAWQATVHAVTKSQTRLKTELTGTLKEGHHWGRKNTPAAGRKDAGEEMALD